jgi:bacterioferritin
MCENWGYQKLAQYVRGEAIDEMKHAEQVIDRILYLDGVPNMQRYFPICVGQTVPEQFEADLQVEIKAVERLNRGIALCRDKADNGSRELLEDILVDEEEHLDWLEAQLGIVKEIGTAAYLAEQIHA